MATAVLKGPKEFVFEWEGKDRGGKQVRGEIRASGENQVKSSLRRQGVMPNKIKKRFENTRSLTSFDQIAVQRVEVKRILAKSGAE